MLDLALTIMQHVALRIIQCDSFCGEAIIANRSILAGCKHSVALTRVLLLFSMTELAVNNPVALPEVYVDDTARLAYGEKEETLENITRAVLDFTQLASSLKLKLSTKGVIAAKIKKDALKLANLLKANNIIYQVTDSTRDLGVSFFNNPKGTRKPTNQRTKQAKKALTKITPLAKIDRKAKILFTRSGFPKYTWGYQVSGMSKMQWLKLETNAANAAGIPKGKCRYSTLCVAYGPNGHPYARGIRELFVLWFKVIIHMQKTPATCIRRHS